MQILLSSLWFFSSLLCSALCFSPLFSSLSSRGHGRIGKIGRSRSSTRGRRSKGRRNSVVRMEGRAVIAAGRNASFLFKHSSPPLLLPCSSSSSLFPALNSISWTRRTNNHHQLLKSFFSHSVSVLPCRRSSLSDDIQSNNAIFCSISSAAALWHCPTTPRNQFGADFTSASTSAASLDSARPPRCLPSSASEEEVVTSSPLEEEMGDGSSSNDKEEEDGKKKKPRAFKSSWDAKDSEGKDYLYRLGAESDNLNISVGARSGLIDDVFIGDFLGKDSDIVFDYRQKVTRSFKNLQGDFYIAPAFLEKVVTHIAKNYLVPHLDSHVPLILGIWGGKGQGKSFQLELICKALGMEPVIMSAGELESEWAGQPGKLIRERYRTASQVIKNQGKMSALVINDLDAGIGRFENTQCTVNNQMVVGSLMNLADNPTRVSIGQEWREADIVNRVPIIVTGNDLSTIWAPLIRDGRMDKFYWQPTREDIVNIVHQMYLKDGLSMEDVGIIVDTFPNQALDFYGALRSRTYDEEVLKWIEKIGGAEKLGVKLVSRKRSDEPLPTFVAPEATVEKLIHAGDSLVQEQRLVNEMRLSDVYMKKQTGGGGLSVMAS